MGDNKSECVAKKRSITHPLIIYEYAGKTSDDAMLEQAYAILFRLAEKYR